MIYHHALIHGQAQQVQRPGICKNICITDITDFQPMIRYNTITQGKDATKRTYIQECVNKNMAPICPNSFAKVQKASSVSCPRCPHSIPQIMGKITMRLTSRQDATNTANILDEAQALAAGWMHIFFCVCQQSRRCRITKAMNMPDLVQEVKSIVRPV